MNIGIIDADLLGRKNHRFPNLACMKISGYYKGLGHTVELIDDYSKLYIDPQLWFEYQDALSEYVKIQKKYTCSNECTKQVSELLAAKMIPCFCRQNFKYDKIFISKVFIDTEIDEDFLSLDFVEYGGTGFFYDKAEPLPYEIEHHMPDYHLYDQWVEQQLNNGGKKLDYKYYTDFSIGFTSRGCFRKCPFCVNKNYNKVELHSPLEEFYDPSRKYICLLDDNVLGFSGWKSIFESLQQTGNRFEYKQGMDMRLMTDEKAQIIHNSKYHGNYMFAFDNIQDKNIMSRRLDIWRKYISFHSSNTKFYVFCGFDRDDKWDSEFWQQDIIDTFERIKVLMSYACSVYLMRYSRYKESPFRGLYITLARWCNQPAFFRKQSLREFVINEGSDYQGKNYASKRYLEEFEKQFPEIANEYFDMKFENLNHYI